MDIHDLPAYLENLKDAAGRAMPEAAGRMAESFEKRMKDDTLMETVHSKGMFWRATAGRPPAYAGGGLRGSVYATPGSSYTSSRASASVGATAVYAALQEWGGRTWPNRGRYMKWTNTGGTWRKRIVTVPEHPYFRTTRDRMVADGSLTRAASYAFMIHTWPYYTG